MTFSVSTPGTLSAWSMTCQDTQINAATGLCDLIFTLQNPLPPLGDIIITVPSQMTVTSLTLNSVLPYAYFNVFCDASYAGNVITFTDIVPSTATTSVPAGTSIDIQLGYLTNPSSLATTSSFAITTYLDTYSIDTVSSGFTYAATEAGTLTVNSITAADTTAGYSTSYSFSITTSNSVANTGGIAITFPSTFTLSSTCSITAKSSNINAASPTCTADTTNLKITLSSLWTSTLAAGSTVTFTISGITNPGNAKPTTAFTFSTLQDTTSSSSIIDQNTTMTISFITAGPLPSADASITPGSYVTSTSTSFTFAFQNFNPCTSGGSIVIQIPTTAISFTSITSTQSSISSKVNIGTSASVVITTSGSYYVITVSQAFSTTYVSGTSFSFQLLYIKTAPTIEPITGITYSTFTSDGYAIDTLSPGLTLTMTSAHTFNTLTVTPSTLVNGASGSYEVDITLDSAHYDGDIITIDFPTVVTLALTSTSTASGSASGVTVTGIQSSNSAIVTLATSSSSIPAGSTLKITISSLTNTGFSQSLGTFTVSSTDAAGFARSSSTYSSSSLVLIAATMPMPSTDVVPYNTIISQTDVNYQFTVDRVNDQGSGGYITVQFPTEITAPSSPQCSNFGGISNIACSTTSNIVKVTGSFDGLPADLIFNISGITNPSISVSGSFVLSTYTSADYLVDQRTTDLRFNADCDNPCKTCTTSSRSACTACFTDATATLTLLYGTTCVDTCPTGTVDISGTCKDCTSPCSECETTQTTCTNCISNYYLYGSTCRTSCPDTYYEDNSTMTCAACSTTCSRCDNYDECLSCPSGKVLYNSNCLSSCPANITIDAGGYCEECDAICDGCTGTTSTCIDCATGYFLYNGKCIQECAATLYFSATSGTCKACDSPCLTCTSASTTCTSCVSGKYLYGNQCVSSCNTGYYEDMSSGSGVCTKCPTGCTACDNELTCTACSSTYYLYSGSCITSCPTGTLASSGNCVSCNTGCASCLGTTTYCTSCSTNYQYDSTSHTCSASCATKQYEDDSTTPYTCKSCDTTCATCDGGTSTDCLSCSNGPYPFLTPSGTCSTSCPSYYYGDTSTNKCVGCNAACSACTGALATTCTACNPNFYLYGTTCVSTCPTTSILVGSTCKSCNSNCLTCSSTTTNCVTCNSGYTLTYDSDAAEYYCKKDTTSSGDGDSGTNTTTTVTTSSSSGVLDAGVVPFPFLIGAFIFLVAVLGAKSAVPETVIPGNLLAFWSYLLFSVSMTWVFYMLYRYDDWSIAFDADTNLPILLLAAGLIMNYVNNIIHLILIYSILRKDSVYQEWRAEKYNKRVWRASITISTLTTFKVFRLTYNKFLGLKCLSAHMSSVASLKPIYYLTIWSVVSSVLPFTAGAAYKIKDGFSGDQLSVFTVEIIILTALCIILCFCDIAKTRDFYAPAIGPEHKTATDANKSKMGLLDDESRIDLDPDLYMAGTDNLKSAADTKGLGPNPRFQTPQNKHPRKKNQQQPIDNPVSFRDSGHSGQKLLKNANNEEPDSVFDKSGNDNTRTGNNDSKSIFLKSKMKNYILSQDTPAETDEILQRNVLTEGSNDPIKGQDQNGGTHNTLPDENKLRSSNNNYVKSITALRSSNPNATEFKRKLDISDSPIHASSIDKLPPGTPGDQIFVVEDQASPDRLMPRNGGGSPRIPQKSNRAAGNKDDPGVVGKSSNVSNQALASERPSYRTSNPSPTAKNNQGNPNSNANSKTLPPTNPSSKVKPSSPVPSHNNRSASPTTKDKNATMFENKRGGSPSTNNRAQSPSPGTRTKTPKTPGTNNQRVSINSKKGVPGPEETRGAAGNSVNRSNDSMISNNPLVDPSEKVFSPVNKLGGAGTHLAFPNPERAANKNNNQQSPINSPVIKQMSTIRHKDSQENLTDNASDGIDPLGNTKNFGTTNNLSVLPRENNHGRDPGDPTSNRISNEFKDFEKLEAGTYVPSERSAMAYDHNMSGITDINRPGNSINPHVQSGESLPQGAKSHLMDSKEYAQNFEKKASTSFLRSLFNKKNNAVQPIDNSSSSPRRNTSSKNQPRFVTEGLSEQPSAPQLNSPDKSSIEKSPELKRANTQRVGTAGRNLRPVSKNRGSKTTNKISSATLYQSGNLESVKDDNILDDSQMREPEIDFSEDSKISMEELDNFAYEDTPSNYNQLNQRFEGESKYIHSRSYLNSKNSQFAKVGTNGGGKLLPQLSGQSSLHGDLSSFEKKGTTLYARVETSTPSTNNFMNKSSKLPEINKK